MNKIKAYGICVYKQTKESYEILLCKSVLSQNRWGFLKGVQENYETKIQTALREFYEESSIKIEEKYIEELYIQDNEYKDIGIYTINYKNIKNIDIYFKNNKLHNQYLCKENSDVEFFNISNLPLIKKKQNKILNNIIKTLNNK